MSTFSTLRARLVTAALLLLLIAAVPALLFIGRPVDPGTAQITVAGGASLHAVARQLEAAGVIRDARLFRLLARLRGDSARVRAGLYDFTRPATPGEVLDRLVAGDVRRLQVTLPEGFDLRQIAARLDAAGIAPADQILRLAEDAAFLDRLQIAAPSLEGYLFPETYTIEAGLAPERVLTTMVEQMRRQLTPELLAAAEVHGLDTNQYLTLASIVQKEAGNDDEMPLIAAVFLNRLRLGIPLQADPTVIYGLGDAYAGNITKDHLRQPTPYNTYTRRGLPPGPIASPGLRALQAVAFPAEVNYLYFVARGDGTHEFSYSLKEHNRAVQRFQLRR